MLSWFRRKTVPEDSNQPCLRTQPGWFRIAVGDLLVDLELPDSFHRDYEEAGAMVAWDDSDRFALRISGITIRGKNPQDRNLCGRTVEADAAEKGRPAVRLAENLGYYSFSESSTWDEGPACNDYWFVGFGNRRLILTLSYLEGDRPQLDLTALHGMVEQAIRSIALNYPDEPRQNDELRIYDLADSQKPWLDYHRRELVCRVQRELGYDGDLLIPLHVLDEFWGRFIAAPPESNDTLNAILNGVGVALGDHLVQAKQFEWIILSDSYGISIALVALRGTANMSTDPFNFVAKRWDRRESEFLVSGFRALCDTADEWKARWQQ
jgi:hypothetical protein